jgi:transcriptional regulator with XRE-family HTH domain
VDLTSNIERIRKEKRLSKADMAKALEMDFSQYSRQEQKGNKLTVEQASKIADALGISLVELLTWGEEKKEEVQNESVALLKSDIEDLKERVWIYKRIHQIDDEGNKAWLSMLNYLLPLIQIMRAMQAELIEYSEFKYANYDYAIELLKDLEKEDIDNINLHTFTYYFYLSLVSLFGKSVELKDTYPYLYKLMKEMENADFIHEYERHYRGIRPLNFNDFDVYPP